jgi:hypothetical protein
MSSGDAVPEGGATVSAPQKISPSRFMRELRPEYYSDTKKRDAYDLDQSTLEYHLDTLTNRNETHDFEIFARKLCERAICPNLRPQTGPEGGGDSKADTETFPVAAEISIAYVGDVAGGSERWAFAFSAKKRWKEKARSDVRGIAETGTGFLQYRDRPGIAFVFMNEEAGKKIFEGWKGRFGSDDAKNDIYLAIIRNLPDHSSSDYLLMVTANPKVVAGSDPRQAIILTSRSMTMTPSDPMNLSRFLDAFESANEF